MQASGATDGGYIQSARISSRTVSVTFDNFGSESLNYLFTPHKDVEFLINKNGVERKIAGRLTLANEIQPTIYDIKEVTLTALCPKPYLNGVDNFGKNLAEKVEMFSLPNSLVTQAVSAKAFEERVHLFNDGDVATGITADFIMRGSVNTPSIKNHSTGAEITINDTFADGDILTISTITGQKGVKKNGANIIHKVSALSVFTDFLKQGDNEISYDAVSGETEMDVFVYYTPQYLGV